VSALCLGTMYFGSRIERADAFAMLDRYYEAGGRFLDTANNYATWIEGYDEPRSERVVGDWLADRGVREEMVVATKMGYNAGDTPASLAPADIEREVAGSLDRLGLDTVDLLYAHVDDRDTPQVETMRKLDALVAEGRVRHLGASNWTAWRLARANRIAEAEGLTRFDCVQPRFSYLIPHRDADFGAQVPATDELIDYCEAADLTLLPYSPTLQGQYGREDRSIPEEYVTSENRIKNEIVADIAAEKDVDGNQVVLAWMLARGATVPVVGFSTMAHLEANLGSLDVELDETDRARLDGVESYGV